MNEKSLGNLLNQYLRSPAARRLARSYRDEPLAYAGAIFLRLRSQLRGRTIQNEVAWLQVNARYHLKSLLTHEKRCRVKQSPKEEKS